MPPSCTSLLNEDDAANERFFRRAMEQGVRRNNPKRARCMEVEMLKHTKRAIEPNTATGNTPTYGFSMHGALRGSFAGP